MRPIFFARQWVRERSICCFWLLFFLCCQFKKKMNDSSWKKEKLDFAHSITKKKIRQNILDCVRLFRTWIQRKKTSRQLSIQILVRSILTTHTDRPATHTYWHRLLTTFEPESIFEEKNLKRLVEKGVSHFQVQIFSSHSLLPPTHTHTAFTLHYYLLGCKMVRS